MSKKVIAVALSCAVLCLGLVGCGKDKAPDASSSVDSKIVSSSEVAESETSEDVVVDAGSEAASESAADVESEAASESASSEASSAVADEKDA